MTIKSMAAEDAEKFLTQFKNATEAIQANNKRQTIGLIKDCPYAISVMKRLAPVLKNPYRKNGEPTARLVDSYIKYKQHFFLQLLDQEDREWLVSRQRVEQASLAHRVGLRSTSPTVIR